MDQMDKEPRPSNKDTEEVLKRTFADVVLDRAIETAEQLEKSGVTDPETRKALEEGLALRLGKTALEYGRNLAKRK